jgi:hypothetical protein
MSSGASTNDAQEIARGGALAARRLREGSRGGGAGVVVVVGAMDRDGSRGGVVVVVVVGAMERDGSRDPGSTSSSSTLRTNAVYWTAAWWPGASSSTRAQHASAP